MSDFHMRLVRLRQRGRKQRVGAGLRVRVGERCVHFPFSQLALTHFTDDLRPLAEEKRCTAVGARHPAPGGDREPTVSGGHHDCFCAQ